jgi:hypothetical protein
MQLLESFGVINFVAGTIFDLFYEIIVKFNSNGNGIGSNEF